MSDPIWNGLEFFFEMDEMFGLALLVCFFFSDSNIKYLDVLNPYCSDSWIEFKICLFLLLIDDSDSWIRMFYLSLIDSKRLMFVGDLKLFIKGVLLNYKLGIYIKRWESSSVWHDTSNISQHFYAHIFPGLRFFTIDVIRLTLRSSYFFNLLRFILLSFSNSIGCIIEFYFLTAIKLMVNFCLV